MRGSQDVLGSPLNITVLAGGIALNESAVYGTGTTTAVAGFPADVFVQVEAGNVLLYPSLREESVFRGLSGLHQFSSFVSPIHMQD